MQSTKTGLKYIAYVRKSEEREERQQLSIQSQKDKIKEHFPDLDIIDVVEETRSAFKPNNRPVFDSVIERIRKGEADGIVGWHPNRISRNEIEAATVTYMLRKGLMKDLKFCTYSFENNPEGIMMLQMIMSQSQYESSKQGRDVKRGMEQKASGGERPGRVPQGYMKVPVTDENGHIIKNKDKVVTKTENDPDRFDLVKRMWRMLLEGTYTAAEIRDIANNQWCYTTPKTKKTGGGPMGDSTIYRIFNSAFYAGYIPHNGELHEGDHEDMITLEEFDYAQTLLAGKGKPRQTTHEYAFSSLIFCGICNCRVVGKTNQRFVQREGKVMTYVHYHCTRKSKHRPCNQMKYTPLRDVEADIEEEIQKYTILPEFRDLALDILKRDNDIEILNRSNIYDTLVKRRKGAQNELDDLAKMRLRKEVDEEQYTRMRNDYTMTIRKLDEELRGTEDRAERWLELTEKAFNFATYAQTHFRIGDIKKKRDILMTLGTNLVLKDQKLVIEPNEWLVKLGNEYPALEAEFLNSRTEEMALVSQNVAVNDSWRAIWDSNPGHGD